MRLWDVKLRFPRERAAARAFDVDDDGAEFW